jgi:hypothetical protein
MKSSRFFLNNVLKTTFQNHFLPADTAPPPPFPAPLPRFPVSHRNLFGPGDDRKKRLAVPADISGGGGEGRFAKKKASRSRTAGFPVISTIFPACLTIWTIRLSPRPLPYSPVCLP